MKDRPLKILALAYDYRPRLGGIATLSDELSRALAHTAGVEIEVIAPEADAEALERMKECDRKAPFSVHRVALPNGPLRSIPALARSIGSRIRAFSPDAVLDFLWLPGGPAYQLGSTYPLCGKLRRPPYFVFAHGVELLESKATLRKRVRKTLSPAKCAIFHMASGVFAVSRFTCGLAERECGLSPEDVHLTYPGVNPKEFFPAPRAEDWVAKFGLEGKKVFLSVSRLEPYKGVDRAIAALGSIQGAHPEAALLVCGEGSDRARLERLAQHYGVGGRVIFAGAIPGHRLRDVYNLSDAFLLLSREEWEEPNVEGFGIAVLEAAACGKPAIAAASGGIPEAAGGRETSWRVDPQDSRSIAGAMREILQNPQLAREKGHAAHQRVIEQFTWENMARRVSDTIREGLTRVRN